MNSFKEQLRCLTKVFSLLEIEYAILGGLAVMIYGEPRLTVDIDVNISIAKEKIDVFLKTARKFGFYPIPKNIKLFIKSTGVIPLKFKKGKTEGRSDIILAENHLEYAAIKRARIKKIDSISVKVVSPEDLIIHKITSDRPRDVADVGGILIRQKGKLDKEYILLWLKRIAKANKKPELLKEFKSALSG
jgi:hypothetical protein